MMYAYKYLNDAVSFEEGKIQVLVIENKKVFRQALRSFYDDASEDLFTFSKNFEPFDFGKIGYFIPDPMNLDFQNKKLSNKIMSVIGQTATDEYYEDLRSIQSALFELFGKINQIYDYEYDSDIEIEFQSILKLLHFNIDTSSRGAAELLMTYIIKLNKYLKFDLFVINGLYDYFDVEEIENIGEMLAYYHINILVLSSSKPERISKYERLNILDADLCVIGNYSEDNY